GEISARDKRLVACAGRTGSDDADANSKPAAAGGVGFCAGLAAGRGCGSGTGFSAFGVTVATVTGRLAAALGEALRTGTDAAAAASSSSSSRPPLSNLAKMLLGGRCAI